jgi:hypothetical protein
VAKIGSFPIRLCRLSSSYDADGILSLSILHPFSYGRTSLPRRGSLTQDDAFGRCLFRGAPFASPAKSSNSQLSRSHRRTRPRRHTKTPRLQEGLPLPTPLTRLCSLRSRQITKCVESHGKGNKCDTPKLSLLTCLYAIYANGSRCFQGTYHSTLPERFSQPSHESLFPIPLSDIASVVVVGPMCWESSQERMLVFRA